MHDKAKKLYAMLRPEAQTWVNSKAFQLSQRETTSFGELESSLHFMENSNPVVTEK